VFISLLLLVKSMI